MVLVGLITYNSAENSAGAVVPFGAVAALLFLLLRRGFWDNYNSAADSLGIPKYTQERRRCC